MSRTFDSNKSAVFYKLAHFNPVGQGSSIVLIPPYKQGGLLYFGQEISQVLVYYLYKRCPHYRRCRKIICTASLVPHIFNGIGKQFFHRCGTHYRLADFICPCFDFWGYALFWLDSGTVCKNYLFGCQHGFFTGNSLYYNSAAEAVSEYNGRYDAELFEFILVIIPHDLEPSPSQHPSI